LRSYGFQTFAPYIDESYDSIADPVKRIERVTHILLEIQARSAAAKNALWHELVPIVEHNYNHFYRGGFRDRLEAELKQMLKNLCGDL
jgi:ppGpp synthetase/RelA/SpoT-type nucleotidyltranferase